MLFAEASQITTLVGSRCIGGPDERSIKGKLCIVI